MTSSEVDEPVHKGIAVKERDRIRPAQWWRPATARPRSPGCGSRQESSGLVEAAVLAGRPICHIAAHLGTLSAAGKRSNTIEFMQRIVVEVSPVEPDRWIAVIDAPRGPFSIKAKTPGQVEREVRSSIADVLGWTKVLIDFVDDLGDPWSVQRSEAQASRLLAP